MEEQVQLRTRFNARWQMWTGKQVFYLHGCIMFGPNVGHLFSTFAMILFSYTMLIYYVLPLTELPAFFEELKVPVTTALFVLNEFLLLCAALVEPGILPKRYPTIKTLQLSQELRNYSRTSFCTVCQIVRPARSRHCRYCDCCTEELDHHCPWLGTCVGKRNYKFFFCFLVNTVLGGMIMLGSSILCMIDWVQRSSDSDDSTDLDDQAGTTTIGESEGTIIVSPSRRASAISFSLVFGLLVVGLVGSLMGFHIYLSARGLLTAEYLRPISATSTVSNSTSDNNVSTSEKLKVDAHMSSEEDKESENKHKSSIEDDKMEDTSVHTPLIVMGDILARSFSVDDSLSLSLAGSDDDDQIDDSEKGQGENGTETWNSVASKGKGPNDTKTPSPRMASPLSISSNKNKQGTNNSSQSVEKMERGEVSAASHKRDTRDTQQKAPSKASEDSKATSYKVMFEDSGSESGSESDGSDTYAGRASHPDNTGSTCCCFCLHPTNLPKMWKSPTFEIDSSQGSRHQRLSRETVAQLRDLLKTYKSQSQS